MSCCTVLLSLCHCALHGVSIMSESEDAGRDRSLPEPGDVKPEGWLVAVLAKEDAGSDPRSASEAPTLRCGQTGGDARDAPEGFVAPEEENSDSDEESSATTRDTDDVASTMPDGVFAVDAPWDSPGRHWRFFAAPMPARRLREIIEPQLHPQVRQMRNIMLGLVRLNGIALDDNDMAIEGDLIRVMWTEDEVDGVAAPRT